MTMTGRGASDNDDDFDLEVPHTMRIPSSGSAIPRHPSTPIHLSAEESERIRCKSLLNSSVKQQKYRAMNQGTVPSARRLVLTQSLSPVRGGAPQFSPTASTALFVSHPRPDDDEFDSPRPDKRQRPAEPEHLGHEPEGSEDPEDQGYPDQYQNRQLKSPIGTQSHTSTPQSQVNAQDYARDGHDHVRDTSNSENEPVPEPMNDPVATSEPQPLPNMSEYTNSRADAARPELSLPAFSPRRPAKVVSRTQTSSIPMSRSTEGSSGENITVNDEIRAQSGNVRKSAGAERKTGDSLAEIDFSETLARIRRATGEHRLRALDPASPGSPIHMPVRDPEPASAPAPIQPTAKFSPPLAQTASSRQIRGTQPILSRIPQLGVPELELLGPSPELTGSPIADGTQQSTFPINRDVRSRRLDSSRWQEKTEGIQVGNLGSTGVGNVSTRPSMLPSRSVFGSSAFGGPKGPPPKAPQLGPDRRSSIAHLSSGGSEPRAVVARTTHETTPEYESPPAPLLQRPTGPISLGDKRSPIKSDMSSFGSNSRTARTAQPGWTREHWLKLDAALDGSEPRKTMSDEELDNYIRHEIVPRLEPEFSIVDASELHGRVLTLVKWYFKQQGYA